MDAISTYPNHKIGISNTSFRRDNCSQYGILFKATVKVCTRLFAIIEKYAIETINIPLQAGPFPSALQWRLKFPY